MPKALRAPTSCRTAPRSWRAIPMSKPKRPPTWRAMPKTTRKRPAIASRRARRRANAANALAPDRLANSERLPRVAAVEKPRVVEQVHELVDGAPPLVARGERHRRAIGQPEARRW